LYHSDGNKGFFEVDLAVPEIGDVSQYLIRNNILERISHPKLPAQNLEFVSNQIISTHAVASYIKSPTEFWVQLDPVSLELIADLIDKLVLDPAFTNENNFTVFKGKPCLAFFPDDQRWYRATVEAVNGDTAQVYYFDYGNNCAVKMSDLRQLPIELSKHAALAFKCSLWLKVKVFLRMPSPPLRLSCLDFLCLPLSAWMSSTESFAFVYILS
jgi:hypothetical protein